MRPTLKNIYLLALGLTFYHHPATAMQVNLTIGGNASLQLINYTTIAPATILMATVGGGGLIYTGVKKCLTTPEEAPERLLQERNSPSAANRKRTGGILIALGTTCTACSILAAHYLQ